MGPLDHLDVSAEELAGLVDGEVWQRWVDAEPLLDALASLTDLRKLRGQQADQLLGALVRLAAKDGGDDELACKAVAHQMAFEAKGIAWELKDLSSDVDNVVLGSLWIEIRAFPWKRRNHAYATSLRCATRRSALKLLLYRPCDRGRIVVRPPEDITDGVVIAVPREPQGLAAAESRQELLEYLNWCVYADWITGEDADLMLELVVAGWQTADQGILKLRRGVCSVHAVQVIAERRGVCAKTIIRERDRVLALLRSAAADYLLEVA